MHTVRPRGRWGRLLCALLLSIGGPAGAQTFPDRPVHLIVPYPAGSTTDIIARLLANPLSERLKQSVVIENRAGAGGAIGVRALKQSPADGYTIGLLVSGNVIQPWLTKDMPFDVRKDFVPLSLMYTGQYVLVTAPDFPAADLAQFVAHVRAHPGKVFYGSSGIGTTTHLAGELLSQVAGIDLTHVPFKGSPEVYSALMSRNIQAYFDLYGTVKAQIESGKVKALGVTGARRLPGLPEVPTIAESVPGYEVTVWTGFAAPLGTPEAAVARLGADLRAVLKSDDFRQQLIRLGVDSGGGSGAEFGRFIAAEYDKWGGVIQKAGLKPE